MCIIMDGNFNEKTLFSQGERLIDAVVTAENLSYVFLMQVLQVN